MKPAGIPERQDWRQRQATFFSQTMCQEWDRRQNAVAPRSGRGGSGLAESLTPLLNQAQKHQTEPYGRLQKCNRATKILARP
jgi:hypothetical protein